MSELTTREPTLTVDVGTDPMILDGEPGAGATDQATGSEGRGEIKPPSEPVIGPLTQPDAIPRSSSSWMALVHRLLRRFGISVSVLGVVVLAFSAFQLWGTGLLEERAQRDLAAELESAIQRQKVASPRRQDDSSRSLSDRSASALGDGNPEVGALLRRTPLSGSAIARIEAPSIGLDKTVVEGVGRNQLREGPGHYPVTPLPGHGGNVAIAGHRTTHGAPFGDLDQLEPGDPITLDTVDGLFTYRVLGQEQPDGTVGGYRVVTPEAVEVIANSGDDRLTLTSCHPRYSNRQSWTAQKVSPVSHRNTTGSVDGVCLWNGCLDLAGDEQVGWVNPHSITPWASDATANNFSGQYGKFAATSGRAYLQKVLSTNEVYCFDYATEAACAGFDTTPTSDSSLYALVADPNNPACLWYNSDPGKIGLFDAYTGAGECSASPVITLLPSAFTPGSSAPRRAESTAGPRSPSTPSVAPVRRPARP